ncbi:hypothetical protein DC007_14680, partial [Enterococcus faecalis]
RRRGVGPRPHDGAHGARQQGQRAGGDLRGAQHHVLPRRVLVGGAPLLHHRRVAPLGEHLPQVRVRLAHEGGDAPGPVHQRDHGDGRHPHGANALATTATVEAVEKKSPARDGRNRD